MLAGVVAASSHGAEPATSLAWPPAGLTVAAPASDPDQLKPPAPASIWKDKVGNGFRKGALEAGVSLGASLGSQILGSTDAHDLGLAKLSVGRVMSEVGSRDRWPGGNWELLGEVFGGEQFKPRHASLAGLTAILRYDFATGTRWVPFFDAGGGVTDTDIGRPDLGGNFQFNLQTGPGVDWFFHKNFALTFQYRFLHLSSAGLENPNHGVNTSALYAGISCFF